MASQCGSHDGDILAIYTKTPDTAEDNSLIVGGILRSDFVEGVDLNKLFEKEWVSRAPMQDKELTALGQLRAKHKLSGHYDEADLIRKQIERDYSVVIEDIVDSSKAIFMFVPAETWAARKAARREKSSQKELLRQKTIRLSKGPDQNSVKRFRSLRSLKAKAKKSGKKKRFGSFVDWLDSKFSVLSRNICILDVAGGNGALSWEILMERQAKCACKVQVTVVDPRRISLSESKSMKLIAASSPDFNNARALNADENLVSIHPKVLATAGVKTCAMARQWFHDIGWRYCSTPFLHDFADKESSLWDSSDLVLGLHPDMATEYIVRVCIKHGKPFAVVPCCVFPKEFPNRTLENGDLVRSREQLCDYLANLHPDIQVEKLESPFPGPCNTVLWWQGKSL